MAFALLVYAAAITVAVAWIVPALVRKIDLPDSASRVLESLGSIGVGAIAAFAALPIYLIISGLFSSLLWDKLSLAVEQHVYGSAPTQRVGCGTQITDSVSRSAFSGGLFIVSLCFCWTGPVAGAVYAGWIGLLDFSASAYLRRGIAFGEEFRKVWRPQGAKGFALMCGLTSLLPFLFVLLLPGMVAGATILCREGERNQP